MVRGVLNTLLDNGIEIREEQIEYGEPDETGGEQAMVNLVAKNVPITAFATYNSYMAAGCMTLLQEKWSSNP